MAINKPELRFRLARVEDYEEVIALRDVYGGWDLLPYCYHKLLADPYFMGIVAETNNEIVSISSY